jgi:predicted ATP-grasp superfamily ATP-dependent carboligase
MDFSFFRNIDHLIVLPSLSLPEEQLKGIEGLIFYEHRMLWTLLLKRYVKKITFLSSKPVSQEYKKYLFKLGNIHQSDQEDIVFISTNKISNNLSYNILNNEKLITKIQKEIKNPLKTLLLPFISTKVERNLSIKLGIKLMGSSKSINEWASKYGNHIIFKETNTPTPMISPNLKSFKEVELEFNNCNPSKKYLLKLNYGVSGKGNFNLNKETIHNLENLDYTEGSIIEEFIEDIKNSPSVQGYIDNNANVKILSTHEQILDETGMVFQGSLFPASKKNQKRDDYLSSKGRRFFKKQILYWFFALDFVETEKGVFAIEINLRQGGTTHPFFMSKLITNSRYCERNLQLSYNNELLYYLSNDNFKSKFNKFGDILDIFKNRGILYDDYKKEGVVFHMTSALKDFNKIGYVIISKSKDRIFELENLLKNLI